MRGVVEFRAESAKGQRGVVSGPSRAGRCFADVEDQAVIDPFVCGREADAPLCSFASFARNCAPLIALLTVSVLASPAWADVENDLGLNPRTAALGGAVSATGGDFAATAYNPAALIVPTDQAGFGELSVGFSAAVPAAWAESLEDGRELALEDPLNAYAVTVGGRFDIGAGLGVPGLVLGLAFYAPVEGLVRSRIRPDDALSWFFIGDRTSHVSLHASLAFRIVDWLSVGAGVRITFDEEAFITGATTEVRRVTDPVTGEERVEAGTRLGIEASIYGRASPVLGVLVAPIPTLRFAFAWRGRLVSDDWGWARLQGIEGVGDIGFVYRFTHVYRPHELAWSAAWRAHDVLEVSAEVTWALWSEAVSPTWRTLEGRFGDIVVPSVGVRVTPTPGVDLLAGYRYVRSPFSDLGGPTNLLTNDTHHASLGLELDLDRLVPDETVPFTVSLSGRLAILEEREEVKDGRRFDSDAALLSNPGYPGYRYAGFVPSVQLSVETRW